ncbi:mitochondrial ribonuclease P catalytic subunit [Gastrophryne carolinensis]
MTRIQVNAAHRPISTSRLANARLDEEVLQIKGKRGTSIFSAGSSKQRASRNKGDQPPLSQDHAPIRIPVPPEPLSPDAWQSFKETTNFSGNFEQRVLEEMIKSDSNLDVAKSLLSYVAAKDGDLSYSLLVKYLVLCIQHNAVAEVCDVYDIMKVKYPVLDTGACSLFIKGLGRTERWREAVDILQTMKKVAPISARNYADCLIAATEHRDLPLAWTFFDEILQNNLQPPEDAIQSLFDTPQDLQEEDYRQRLIAILYYFRENQIYPGEKLMTSINAWFESVPKETWRGKLTKVTDGGHCQACKQQLESIHLTAAEYATLKNAVIERIIKGEDTFRKTTPQELQKFLQFVNARPPYDIVVDGLNVAYLSRKAVLSQSLLDVVSCLAEKGKRILVLGRKHMLVPSKKWVAKDIQRLQGYGDCFFLDNVTLDDPFLLYACLNSGSHCCFLTSDLLRDHKACLPDAETKRLFFKWQRGHQLVLPFHVSGSIRLRPILNYDTILQSTATSWHIPYDPSDVKRTSFEVPRTWLCLKKEQ